MTLNPIVYLPIEMGARELDSKALLAARIAERGYPVVLGQQWMLFANLDRLPPGVMLFKSFNRIHQPAMQQARRAGHRVVAMEEELMAHTEEKRIAQFAEASIFQVADLLLAGGEFERDTLQRLGGANARVALTGNGRIDLLKPAVRAFYRPQVDELRRRHGDFVLVNTNFSTVNSIWESVQRVTDIEIGAGFLDPSDAAAMRNWNNFVAYEEANRSAMHAAVGELARRRPRQKIIVRPHPAESLQSWGRAFPGSPNVEIIREGSHVAWTLACRLLLHTSCTTGFEAYVAGQPALNLVPGRGWTSDSLLSTQVNPVFTGAAELVAAAEAVLDGGRAPAPQPTLEPQRFVWNLGANEGARRTAELLLDGLPPPRALELPALQNVTREEALRNKFQLAPAGCAETLQRLGAAFGISAPMRVDGLGDSLFLVAPAQAAAAAVKATAPLPEYAELRREMEGACQSGNFQRAYDLFRQNFATAQRHADLCFFTGVALFETGRHALALQYFQAASLANNAVDWNISFWLARTYQRLGEMDAARRYAEQAWQLGPMDAASFDLYKELALRTGKDAPEHWIIIGCSHVRYFRYMQVNQRRFFDGRVQLECYEFGGATAYGLGNASSQAGALHATRQLRARLAQADRVLVQFGEVDCRRAAWKAAAVAGRPIEQAITESAQQLETYVRQEILPHNRNVVLVGAKPQIVGDEDFYKVAAADQERIIFQPLAERERVTVLFNSLLREAAGRLKIDYTDMHHLLADEKARKQFFKKVYWDAYTTDTHGNVDYLARAYFERLKAFVA